MSEQVTDTPVSTEITGTTPPTDTPAQADTPVTPVDTDTPETPTPETPTTTPPEETTETGEVNLDLLTEEDIEAAIAAATEITKRPTKPVSFPEKKEGTPETANLDSEIQALLKQKDSEIEEAKQKAQESQSASEQVEGAWRMLNEALPDVTDILEKLVAGDPEAVPMFYKKDFQERLQSDSTLWPLIEAHARGETPDYPGFVRALAANSRKAMPSTADATKEATPPPPEVSNGPASMMTKNKKTLSILR